MEAFLHYKHMKRICVLILVLLWAWSVVGNSSVPGDSIGLKVINGKSLVVYKMGAGETAYAVSRRFNVPFKDIAAANEGVDMGALKIGQEIYVPWENTVTATKTQIAPVVDKMDDRVPEEVMDEPEKTVVDKPEIPADKAADAKNTDPTILATTDLSTTPAAPNNDKSKSFAQMYGEYLGSEKIASTEKGVATWIDNNGIQSSGDRFYALHNTAPVGSIVKIRNLMNNRIIYAKVIGNLTESEVNEKVLIKLSAGAAERLNVLDNRFVVEITYYVNDDAAMK